MGKPIEGITDRALQILHNYDWPGNIRELENMLERAIVLCDGRVLEPEAFPIDERSAPRSAKASFVAPPVGTVPLDDALERLERSMLEGALEQAGGVKTKTAELLGIKTSALYYKLEKYGISSND
jgi:two-component system response regulator HydG